MLHRDEYYQWPFLTNDEFELACAYFHKKYVGAELGRRRRTFKIYHQRDLTEGTSYIEIRRLLVIDQDADDLSRDLEKLRADDWAHQCSDMGVDTSLEDADEEALHSKRSQVLLPQYKPRSHGPYVTYEIHLHPTYRMPTLWFTLHDLPMSEPAFDLDSVYRYLVPDEYKNRLREIGPLGGISAAPHPLTDLPAFFIHPCQSKEAMEDFNTTLGDYLTVWLGIVGGCVGLWIPHEMATVEV